MIHWYIAPFPIQRPRNYSVCFVGTKILVATIFFMKTRTKEQKSTSNDINFCNLREIYPINMVKTYWILLQKQSQMLQKRLPKSTF